MNYKLPSRIEEISKLSELINRTFSLNHDLAYLVNLCLEELITNIIWHGLKGRGDSEIEVTIDLSPSRLQIVLVDQAPPYDPFSRAAKPNVDAALDERNLGGLGVYLVRKLMDDASYFYDSQGNHITLLKTIPWELASD